MGETEYPWHGGIADPNRKIIIVEDSKWLGHEARHVLCILEYKHPMELHRCHQAIDTEDIMEQSRNETDPTPEPPKQTHKTTQSWRYM